MTGSANKPAENKTPNPFFYDYSIGGLSLSGTGEGGGGKGAGISLGGINTGGNTKALAYKGDSFTKKGLEDKKYSRSNQQLGDQWRRDHPGTGLAQLYAGDLGSKGGLSLSDPKKKGADGKSGPDNKFKGTGTIVRSSFNPKTGWQPVMKGDKPAAKVDGAKKPIVPPTDTRRSYDPPKTPLVPLGSIGKDEDASAWDKPKTWTASNGVTYQWGDPLGGLEGAPWGPLSK